MRGPCVFKGYFKNPERTAEMLDDEGFLHSGDVGVLYPNGTIKIIDRSKNIFKLSQGEYVAPEKLENIFIQSPFVAQCLVYGDSLKHCTVAVVVIDPAPLQAYAAQHGTTAQALMESQDAGLKKAVMDEMKELADKKQLNNIERPKDIFMTTDAFSVENDILTPTFKLKRNVGAKVFKD